MPSREKTPTGVKILWFWAFGTAAILITNVMTTRIRDLDKLMNAEQQQQQQQQQQQHDTTTADTVILPSDSHISEDKD